jgi:hypothetical protein
VAPTVLVGELDERPVYTEQLPRGVWMSDHQPPDELLPFVVAELRSGLSVLHEVGEVHGAVGPDRVFLGLDGEVVLCGRGRRGAAREIDVAMALSLLVVDEDITITEDMATELAEQGPPDAREQLGTFVRGVYEEPTVVDQVVLLVDEGEGTVDEVVPDIGVEKGGKGLLDRWSATTTGGVTPDAIDLSDTTQEMSATQVGLDISIWRRVSAPLQSAPPDDRFDAIEGSPSRAIRSLLAEEPPEVLPVPLGGRTDPFAGRRPSPEEVPTQTLAAPVEAHTRGTAHKVGPPVWPMTASAMVLGGLVTWITILIMGGRW